MQTAAQRGTAAYRASCTHSSTHGTVTSRTGGEGGISQKGREGSQGWEIGKHLHFSDRRSLQSLPRRLRRYRWER